MGLYNSFLEQILMPLGDYINRSNVMDNLKEWRRISKLPEDEILILQKKNLSDLLDFATLNISYYKEFRKYESDDPYTWIKMLPVMKKADYNSNIDSLTSKPLSQLIKKQTSGSSGVQGTTYMDTKDQALNRAIQILWWEWAGWKMGTPILQTGMTVKRGLLKSIKDLILKTKYCSAFELSDYEAVSLLTSQKNKKDFFIGGYASSIYILAKIAEEKNISDIHFNGAISWGDKMFPHFRKQIQKTFGCRVTDTYACSEGIMMAAQKDLDHYYIMAPHVYLELLDSEGKEVEDGEMGYVVATRLDARSMPLIRYYTGDLAMKLPREKYPAIREYNFPLLEKIVGRDTDIVYTPSGKYMIVHFFTVIFEYINEIEQFRVIQKSLDSIIIEYIPSPTFKDEVLRSVEIQIHNHLKEPFGITWKRVTQIPPTASGKPQIIKSYIENKL